MQAKLLALALSLGLTFSVVPTAHAQEELLNLEPAIATSQAQEEALTSRVEAATKASRAARLLQVRAVKLVDAAAALKGEVHASEQYWRCLPAEAQAVFGNVRIGQR